MSKKVLIFLMLMSISIVGTFGGVNAQTSSSSATSSPSLIALSTGQLNFYGQEGLPSLIGQEGAGNISRTINVVGLVNDTIEVTLVRADIYSNNTGTGISYNSIRIDPSNFTLTKNELKIVTISLDTSGIKSGTYQGTIIVTAATDTSNETVSTVSITAKIDIWNPVFTTELALFLILFFFCLSLVIGLVVPKAQITRKAVASARKAKARADILKRKEEGHDTDVSGKKLELNVEEKIDKKVEKLTATPTAPDSLYLFKHEYFNFKQKYLNKFLAVVSAFVAVFIWVYLITAPGMSFTDPGNFFSTAIMVPLVAYVIGLVTGKVGNGSDGGKPKK